MKFVLDEEEPIASIVPPTKEPVRMKRKLTKWLKSQQLIKKKLVTKQQKQNNIKGVTERVTSFLQDVLESIGE